MAFTKSQKIPLEPLPICEPGDNGCDTQVHDFKRLPSPALPSRIVFVRLARRGAIVRSAPAKGSLPIGHEANPHRRWKSNRPSKRPEAASSLPRGRWAALPRRERPWRCRLTRTCKIRRFRRGGPRLSYRAWQSSPLRRRGLPEVQPSDRDG
jgi:hypothetical protein